MAETIEENTDEMTELEREIITSRIEDMDEEDKCSVDEFLEDF